MASETNAPSQFPTSRKQAIEQGERLYFTGKPCPRNHVAMRNVKGGCVQCSFEIAVANGNGCSIEAPNKKRSIKPANADSMSTEECEEMRRWKEANG
ncbi:MAG: hypothetical protein ACPGYT_11890 [Nitrospirales bacterium]